MKIKVKLNELKQIIKEMLLLEAGWQMQISFQKTDKYGKESTWPILEFWAVSPLTKMHIKAKETEYQIDPKFREYMDHLTNFILSQLEHYFSGNIDEIINIRKEKPTLYSAPYYNIVFKKIMNKHVVRNVLQKIFDRYSVLMSKHFGEKAKLTIDFQRPTYENLPTMEN